MCDFGHHTHHEHYGFLVDCSKRSRRGSPWRRIRRACLTVLVATAWVPCGYAAQGPAALPGGLTLPQALRYALDHYPSVKVAVEQINASTAGIDVARASYLPRLDSLWQSNRATANNVFGQLLPQSVIPSLSGPVLPSASSDSVWGSAVGAFFSWEAIDLGLRDATVSSAELVAARSRREHDLTRLEVQGAVGAAYLAVVAAERAVTATQADLERRTALARVARALADSQLRPGAEASRAEAERALADTRTIQARQQLALANVTLRRVLGVSIGTVAVDAAALFAEAPSRPDAPAAPATHPFAELRQASVGVARAQEDILAHTDRPRVLLQSSLFARGSGARTNGVFDGSFSGLGLDRANWAAGVQVIFPNLFDFSALKARKAAAAAVTHAETARHAEAVLAVSSQQAAAQVMVEAAQAVAANTPVQLAAARLGESQASARYAAGLASIVEVADAQSLLAQAEYLSQVARVDVWRALLADALARGNVDSFVALL